jgi:hypothetical protein
MPAFGVFKLVEEVMAFVMSERMPCRKMPRIRQRDGVRVFP